MNELKQKLVALGLSEEMAEKVIVTVATFVKSKIPANYHRTIDEILAGNAPDFGSILGKLGLGGFFGGR